MKTSTARVEVVTYASEVQPEIATNDADLAHVLEWADAHPDAWRVVLGKKSAAWGRGSTHYPGWARNDTPAGVLERMAVFKRHVHGAYPPASPASFFDWSSVFTLDHCREPGFRGDLFRQVDPAGYSRGCASLDFTPETLEEVIVRFRTWAEGPPLSHPTAAVLVGDRVVFGQVPILRAMTSPLSDAPR